MAGRGRQVAGHPVHRSDRLGDLVGEAVEGPGHGGQLVAAVLRHPDGQIPLAVGDIGEAGLQPAQRALDRQQQQRYEHRHRQQRAGADCADMSTASSCAAVASRWKWAIAKRRMVTR